MSIALWLVVTVLTPVILWLAFCAVIWIHFFIWGHKHDHSGDGGLAVMALPFIPLALAHQAYCDVKARITKLFRK